MPKKPHFDLADVKRLAVEAMTLAHTRAKKPLMERYGTGAKARAFASRVLADLEEEAFVETVELKFEQKFDVYGVIEDGTLWYIKLTVDIEHEGPNLGEDKLVVLSFHESEHAMDTVGGHLDIPAEEGSEES